jgi:hypothetical protein
MCASHQCGISVRNFNGKYLTNFSWNLWLSSRIKYGLSLRKTKQVRRRFEVFTAVTMKNAAFWDVAPCRSCVNWRFGGMFRLHIQGRKIRERGTRVSRLLQTELPVRKRMDGVTVWAVNYYRLQIFNSWKLINSKQFWRWCITHRMTGFLDIFPRLIF